MLRGYFDHHIHTDWSPDSVAPLEAYLQAGIRDLVVTDHVDIGSPDPLFETWPDYDQVFRAVRELETRYDARIRVGVEMGYQPEYLDEMERFVASHPFSFVIGSIHFGDGLDFYNGDYFVGKTQQEAYQRYFELVLEMVERFRGFDVVGHLDYITRYGPYPDKRYAFSEFEPIIGRILETLVKQGRGLEINTSGMRNTLNVFHPGEETVRRFAALGGRVITLGSDAHRVEDYGMHFREAADFLKRCGVVEIARFEDRKPTFLTL